MADIDEDNATATELQEMPSSSRTDPEASSATLDASGKKKKRTKRKQRDGLDGLESVEEQELSKEPRSRRARRRSDLDTDESDDELAQKKWRRERRRAKRMRQFQNEEEAAAAVSTLNLDSTSSTLVEEVQQLETAEIPSVNSPWKKHWGRVEHPVRKVLSMFGVLALGYLLTYLILGDIALPVGPVFAFILLMLCSFLAGYLAMLSRFFPPALAMMLAGVLLRNVPGGILDSLIKEQSWVSSSIRSIILSLVMSRAGLNLNLPVIKANAFVVARFAFLPAIAEALIDTLAAYYLLGLPIIWSFVLGFVTCVSAPALIIPWMLQLIEHKLGMDKGIPSVVIAAVSLDPIVGITGLGITINLAVSQSTNLGWLGVHGPLEIVFGILTGCAGAAILFYILPYPGLRGGNLATFRAWTLLLMAAAQYFSLYVATFLAGGFLSCMIVGLLAQLKWKTDKVPVSKFMGELFLLLQPALFGFIGAALSLSTLDPQEAGIMIGIAVLSSSTRFVVVFLSAFTTSKRFSFKEMLYYTAALFPKAAVHAVISTIPLQQVMQHNPTETNILYATKVLNLAVLHALFASTVGIPYMVFSSQKLLKKPPPPQPSTEV